MNKHRTKLQITMQTCLLALLTLFAAASAGAQTSDPDSARDDVITPPPVPTDVRVEAGNKAFLVGHATGTQNYVCLPSGSGVAWALFTPQATLFDDEGQQITTHFFSPNPFEGGVIRATWQHSRDTSTVWGRVTGISSDPNFVTPGAIPWLLVQVKDVGALAGPTGGTRLTGTTFIQRLNTVGGAAPSTGCSALTDLGAKAFVPYTADYFFYKQQ
jgi:Protein of unknown function (DUF3455)